MTNIQVVVRCRGRNQRELNANSQVVVDLPSDTYSTIHPTITINQHQNNVLSQKILNSLDSKTYNFDQVYGPLADQQLIYQKVITPLFNDFFNGFNVTVLAYGQTGTGKTYTMCGKNEMDKKFEGGESTETMVNEHSGIIPRVLNDLFSRLQDNDDDYIVKCSFIELYNENLKDLLNDENGACYSSSQSNSSQSHANSNSHSLNNNGLKIYENKKSNSNSILISNLKEVNINSLQSGYNLLRSGLQKRKIASTKLNDVSSRSHTIFTVNLYKRQRPSSNNNTRHDSDDFVRHSKINLVDLAGLENINKSGSINQRAKEAGSINQSLLTLGRVINSLSDSKANSHNNHPNLNHIPYRESKLTRLLQDSIGGKTKTCLISTISPAKINLEETLSTLEYSLKVKSIENKPQLGQDFNIIMKQVLIKDLSHEIIKLNNDLMATRQKSGIYMNESNYNNLMEENASHKQEINELSLKIKLLNDKIYKYEQELEYKGKVEQDLKRQLEIGKQSEGELHNQLEGVTQSIQLVNNIIMQRMNNDNQNDQVRDSELISLINSLTSNLQIMKVNFTHNYETLNHDLRKSIKDLPHILHNLIKTSNKNDELFNNFKGTQIAYHEQLRHINNQFQDYLVNESNFINDLQPVIQTFVANDVNKQINEFKTQLLNKFAQLIKFQTSGLESSLQSSISSYSNDLVTNNLQQISKESSQRGEKQNDILNKSVAAFDSYQTQLIESNNGHEQLINRISKEVMNDKLLNNLHKLSESFDIDNSNVHKVIPGFSELNEKQLEMNKSNQEQFGDIYNLLSERQNRQVSTGDGSRSESKNGHKSPLKVSDQNNRIRSPVKSPHKSPMRSPLPNKGFRSKIPTLKDKENTIPDLKKRKFNT